MEIYKDQFEEMISGIDDALADDNVPIPRRPITAAIELQKRLHVSAPIFHPYAKDLSYPIKLNNISCHVYQWYEVTYGDLVKIDPRPAKFPFSLHGNAYEVSLPLLFGSFQIIGSKKKTSNPRILNAVDSIENLPVHVRNKMSGEEENYIQVLFYTCLETAGELKKHNSDLTDSAINDIIVSCDLISGSNKNYSLSAWHSLQFIEKIFKKFISIHAEFQKIHDINKLKEMATQFGYKADPKINWDLFDFGPSVRYEPQSIEYESAIKINHEAWKAAFNVLKQI